MMECGAPIRGSSNRTEGNDDFWYPHRKLWKALVTVIVSVVLCSCQALPRTNVPVGPAKGPPSPTPARAMNDPSVPPTTVSPARPPAWSDSAPLAISHLPPPEYLVGPPVPPPAFVDPMHPLLSAEEFIGNGGDREPAVVVKRDHTVHGLHPGDTIAHYHTVDGQRRTCRSNEVCLYAPRFAAVRKVYGPLMNEQHDRPAGVELPLTAVQSGEVGEPTTVVQPLQPGRRHAVATAQQFRDRTQGVGVDNAQIPATAQDRFLPFEDLLIIRRGEFDNSEKARLAERLQAAIAWTKNQAPQVAIDNQTAQESVGTAGLESVYTYVLPPGKPCLRVVKIASRHSAHSGDIVHFTIRFDNVGDQPINNVTVLDRLHDRLEYVEGSQKCTRTAEFLTEKQDDLPRVLQWVINESMKVGEGGIIRFQCQVR